MTRNVQKYGTVDIEDILSTFKTKTLFSHRFKNGQPKHCRLEYWIFLYHLYNYTKSYVAL